MVSASTLSPGLHNAADEKLIEVVTQAVATKLTPQEAHAVGVSLVIRFGRGCEEARTYAKHVNATREWLGLPKIVQAVAKKSES